VLHRVADATVRSLLARIAGLLADPVAEASERDVPASGTNPGDILPELP